MDEETKLKKLTISFKSNAWYSTWITNKIYRLVEKNEEKDSIGIKEANIKIKKGSLDIVIDIMAVASFIYVIQDRFIEYMIRKREREKEKEREEARLKIECDGKIKYI